MALKVAPCAMRYATIFYAARALCDDFLCVMRDVLCAMRQFPMRHARCVIAMLNGATKQLTGARSTGVLVLRAARSSQVWCRSICACDVCTACISGS